MNFFIEWALAVHRAIWFPVFWTLGLDRPAIEVPLEIGVELATTAPAGSVAGKVTRARRRTKLAA
jgi:hypothetical protein